MTEAVGQVDLLQARDVAASEIYLWLVLQGMLNGEDCSSKAIVAS
jgi:hypothetical protein